MTKAQFITLPQHEQAAHLGRLLATHIAEDAATSVEMDELEQLAPAFLSALSTPSVSLLQEGAASPAPLADAELGELAGLDFSELRVSATTCQNMQNAGQRTVKVDVKDLTRHLTRALTISCALPGLLARLAAAEQKLSALSQYQQERGGRYSLGVSKQDLLDAANQVQSRGLKREASMMRSLIDQVEDLQELAPTPVAIEEGGGGKWLKLTEEQPKFPEGRDSIECLVLLSDNTVSTASYCRQPYAMTAKGRAPRWEKNHRIWYGALITHFSYLPTAPAKKEAPNG